MSYSVFKVNKGSDHLKQPMFLGDSVAIARYDQVKYPIFEKLVEKLLGWFWRPQEVELSKDGKDFKSLSDKEQHIFTSNLKRQILLDSIQGRALSLSLGWITSLPELENLFKVWEFGETIHSRTYTHIIRNVFPNPSVVFDSMLDIEEIVDCAGDISKDYDNLIEYNKLVDVFGYGAKVDDSDGGDLRLEEYEHKRLIWRCLHAVNALEGIRFYVSFAASWNFAEQGLMTGNANLIKLICRDENVHLAASQHMIKLLLKEDPDYVKIAAEEAPYIFQMITNVVNQEKIWAKYLMKYGAVLGLNEEILCTFIDYIAAKRATSIGVKGFKQIPNPLPWTDKWIGGKDVQVAPQESEIISYTSSNVKNDVRVDSFKGFSL